MPSRLAMKAAAPWLLAPCVFCGCLPASDLPEDDAVLAETLMASIDFEGGTVIAGALPLTTADDVVIEPLVETVIMSPGASSIMGIEVDNPEESDDPVVATLVQFQGARDYVEVVARNKVPATARDGSGAGDSDAGAPAAATTRSRIDNEFSVASDVCDRLCDKLHAIDLAEVSMLDSGAVGARSTRTAVLDCRDAGTRDACDGDVADDIDLGAVEMPGETGGPGQMPIGGTDTMEPAGTGGSDGMGTSPADPATACDGQQCAMQVDGVFAFRTQLDLWWVDDSAPPLFDAGRDTVTLHFVAEIAGACGGAATATVRACDVALPVVTSDANCDALQYELAADAWDAPSMPTLDVQIDSIAFGPDELFQLASTAGLWGIELDDPAGGWPTPAEVGTLACPSGIGVSCFPDHDADGYPGITVTMGRIGQQLPGQSCGLMQLPIVFRGAPLDAIGAIDDNSVRAQTISAGLRMDPGLRATVAPDCASGVADAMASEVSLRAIDCVATDGNPCQPAQAQFVDENLPYYNVLQANAAPPAVDPRTGVDVLLPQAQGGGLLDQTPSVGPRSAMVRLGDIGTPFNCGDVSGAPFPAL